jgi:mono/diheme cytochrome c family protein/uncharacterized OB-fold protein
MQPNINTVFAWLVPLIVFSAITFILGFVYGKFKVRKDSSTGVVDNSKTISNNQTKGSVSNCSNCGAEIVPKDAKFCKHCGAKVEQVITTSTTVKAEAIKPPTIEKKIVDEVKIDKPDDVAIHQETNKKIEKPLVHKDIKPSSKNNQARNTLILLSIFVIILIVVFSKSDRMPPNYEAAYAYLDYNKAKVEVHKNDSPSWTRGKHIYNDDCAGCHKADGSGMPPIFPALKNSSVVNGPTPKLVDIILHGKGGMPTFGVKSNTYIAQVITYVKNNFNNSEIFVPYSTIRKKVNLARPNSNSLPTDNNQPLRIPDLKYKNGKTKEYYERNGYTWIELDYYVGWSKNNKLNGYGLVTFRDSLNTYEGEILNDKKHGQGVTTWGGGQWKGDRYEGQYKDNKMNGKGVYISANGDRYEGEWKDDKKSKGIMTWTNGDRYEGQYKDGKKHGQGVYIKANGARYEGTWKHGEL